MKPKFKVWDEAWTINEDLYEEKKIKIEPWIIEAVEPVEWTSICSVTINWNKTFDAIVFYTIQECTLHYQKVEKQLRDEAWILVEWLS